MICELSYQSFPDVAVEVIKWRLGLIFLLGLCLNQWDESFRTFSRYLVVNGINVLPGSGLGNFWKYREIALERHLLDLLTGRGLSI